MALHSSVPSTLTSDDRHGLGQTLLRPAAALVLAAILACGAAASHSQVTPAFGPAPALADGGSGTNGGPCWGCGG